MHRRRAGTFLFAPEGHREALGETLGPVVNGKEWILHAAGEDLASLALLGLEPGSLFDTELAARLAGFERPNLGAMVEHFTGTTLEKGHGREDWSTTPLPDEWLVYAAEDVTYLHILAEALAEELDARGMLDAAEQEFAHIIATRSTPPAQKTWRDVKGMSTVRTPAGLQIARALFAERDATARAQDISPSTVLPSRVIVEVAKAEPNHPGELAKVHGFPARKRGATGRWFGVIEAALRERRQAWPAPSRRASDVPPSKSHWQRHYPESYAVLDAARGHIAEAAAELGIGAENVVAPAVLRQVIWAATDDPVELTAALGTDFACRRLLEAGARPWQASIAGPRIARAYSESAG